MPQSETPLNDGQRLEGETTATKPGAYCWICGDRVQRLNRIVEVNREWIHALCWRTFKANVSNRRDRTGPCRRCGGGWIRIGAPHDCPTRSRRAQIVECPSCGRSFMTGIQHHCAPGLWRSA